MSDEKYDTQIYTDYDDLPELTKKRLFAEWLGAFPDEKKIRNFGRLLPLLFAMGTALLVIASVILIITLHINPTSVVLLALAVVCLIGCIIFNERSARMLYDQSARYAVWLKHEKRILATLKARRTNKKK